MRRPPLHAVPQLVDRDAGRPGVFPLSHCWAAEARGWGEGPAGVGRTAGAPGVGGWEVGGITSVCVGVYVLGLPSARSRSTSTYCPVRRASVLEGGAHCQVSRLGALLPAPCSFLLYAGRAGVGAACPRPICCYRPVPPRTANRLPAGGFVLTLC